MDAAVLFISPYLQDAQVLGLMLAEASLVLIHATCLREAVTRLESDRFPAVLTEAKLDDGTWQDVLPLARSQGAELIVTDASADARFWAEAINLGAYDLLVQPFQETEVRRVLSSASSQRRGAWRRKAAS
jgi:DNA-binding NtrC family response regulator